MRRVLIYTCIVFVFLFAQAGAQAQQSEAASSNPAQVSVASVPRLIQFNGAVKDRTGEPLGGAAVRLTFSVYEEPQGGAALWTESQVLQLDEQGRYTVLLGASSSQGVPVELFPAGKARWMGVQVENRDEDPRVLMVSVPYALKAEDAEKLGGKRASDFVLAEQLDEKLRTAVAVLMPADSTSGSTSKALAVAPAAAGGGGAPKPQPGTEFVASNATQVVLVQQHGTGDGLRSQTESTETDAAAVRGEASAAAGGAVGVFGISSSASGTAGVFDNLAGGKILVGRVNGAERFRVDGDGSVRANAYLDLFGNPVGTGTVTNVATGTGLNGGPITTAGTLTLDTTFTDARYTQIGHTHVVGDVTGAATLGTNAFVGLQTITGNLNLTGAINSNGLRIEPTANTPNVIAGDSQNWVGAGVAGATIAGGGPRVDSSGLHIVPNRVTHSTGTVGGGADNQAGDDAGMPDEGACCATVGGGLANKASGGASTVSGGYNNIAAAPPLDPNNPNSSTWTAATIGGGQDNKASNWADTVAGGGSNTAKGAGSTVGGGTGNTAAQWADTVGGGTGNTADGVWATVPGGNANTAGFASFAAGTRAKAISGGSFVWGDYTEADVTDAGWNSFVVRASGGAFFSNNLTAGGTLSAPGLSISGSINGALRFETYDGRPTVIGGHSANDVTDGVTGGTIAGGGDDAQPNRVTDDWNVVGGGHGNQAGNNDEDVHNASGATVAGGEQNTALNPGDTVGGGLRNLASGDRSTVGGGIDNTASGYASTVPGGWLNTAQAHTSFAAGHRAKALHDGSFVWGDATDADVESTAWGQFTARANGGFRFITGVDAAGIPQTTVGFEGGSGNITTPGNVTAASFTGDGAGLTGINVQVSNADTVDGAHAIEFAPAVHGHTVDQVPGAATTLGPNTFTGDQTFAGTVTGGVTQLAGNTSGPILNVEQGGTGVGIIVTSAASNAIFGNSTAGTGSTYGVVGASNSTEGRGMQGTAFASSGRTFGVKGDAFSPEGTGVIGQSPGGAGGAGVEGVSTSGIGVLGYTTDTEANTVGVYGRVASINGVAGVFENLAGGKLLSGQVNGAEKFTVDGFGNVTASGGVAAVSFSGDGSNLTGIHAGTATGLDCEGCVGNQQLGINYASSDSKGGAATSALWALNAANAQTLGGHGLESFARLDIGNDFSGRQGMYGNTADEVLKVDQNGSGTALIAQQLNSSGGSAIYATNVGDAATISGVSSGNGSGVDGTSPTFGVRGMSDGSTGTGVYGVARSATGTTTGVMGHVESLEGIAGSFVNQQGGKILSGATAEGEKFRVEGSGNVWAAGTFTGTFTGNGSGLTDLNIENVQGAVTQAQLTAEVGALQAADSAEMATRIAADASLQGNLDNETAVRAAEDAALLASRAGLGPNSFGGTQTITSGDLSLASGIISLPDTTGASVGVVNLGGASFIHACCDPSAENTFVGRNAGNFSISGEHNTAIGQGALQSNTSGFFNTATGLGALTANTTGRQNTASGQMALYANISGNENAAFGNAALVTNTAGSENSASGTFALYYNTTGSDNTASGYHALFDNRDGNSNTAVGVGAGVGNMSGSNNTFLGAGAQTNWQHPDLNYATAIGAGAVVSQNNSLVLGGTGASAVNVGIGTSAPSQRLEVIGNINAVGNVNATSYTGDGSALAGILTQGSLDAEAADRAAADAVLQSHLDAEAAARISADDALTSGLNAEAAARATGDNALQTNLDAEVSSRTTADSNLQSAIDGRAILAGGNNFVGNQNITGNLFVIGGSINGALRLETSGYSPNVIAGSGVNYATPGLSGGTIGGGGFGEMPNRVTDYFGTIAGGINNQAGDNAGDTNDRGFATVGGGFGNSASNAGATVGGGQGNSAGGAASVVGGGANNSASEQYSAVGGGSANTASGDHAVVGGGQDNSAAGLLATVGGGVLNIASNQFAVIGGGNHNQVSGAAATVGGGHSNIATGNGATIPGGVDNVAQGYQSFAAGTRAKALHDGSFVWGDWQPADVASTGHNQFIARASGGVTFYTDGSLSAGVTVAAGGGAWNSLSDRNVKDNIIPVDGRMLLARLMELPVFTWNYRTQKPTIRHIGPMAQDFRAAFNLGEDEKHISTVDADGVSLAAIQALYQLSLEKDKKIDQLSRDLEALRAEVEQLKQAIAK